MPTVSFLTCTPAPVEHFIAFAKSLPSNTSIQIYTTESLAQRFKNNGFTVNPFSITNLIPEDLERKAVQIAILCRNSDIIITDLGDPFDVIVQKALSEHSVKTLRLAYYENFERDVPGYSTIAADVAKVTQGVLFANSHLVKQGLFESTCKVGIGYYPIHLAVEMKGRRAAEQEVTRELLFKQHNLMENGQEIAVYFGGANDVYYNQAFPAFLSLLEKGIEQSDLSHLVILIQQHPRAREKNIDGLLASAWIEKHKENPKAPKVILSTPEFSGEEAQIVANKALYYQTTMAPQFALSGIFTAQVGHEPFNDILVRNKIIPSATSAEGLMEILTQSSKLEKEIDQKLIVEALGYIDSWEKNLRYVLKHPDLFQKSQIKAPEDISKGADNIN